jgi:hypothetical protein
MASDVEHLPGWPAPTTGTYRLVNARGTRTAIQVGLTAGDKLPTAPADYAWRLERNADGSKPDQRRFAVSPASMPHHMSTAQYPSPPASNRLDATAGAESAD